MCKDFCANICFNSMHTRIFSSFFFVYLLVRIPSKEGSSRTKNLATTTRKCCKSDSTALKLNNTKNTNKTQAIVICKLCNATQCAVDSGLRSSMKYFQTRRLNVISESISWLVYETPCPNSWQALIEPKSTKDGPFKWATKQPSSLPKQLLTLHKDTWPVQGLCEGGSRIPHPPFLHF